MTSVAPKRAGHRPADETGGRPASESGHPFADLPQTIPDMLAISYRRFAAKTAYLAKREGRYVNFSFSALEVAVRACREALRAAGIRPGDHIALLSENRPEWAQVDLAALELGAVTVPLHTCLKADQLADILRDCRPRLLVASRPDLARELWRARQLAASRAPLAVVERAALAAAPDAVLLPDFTASPPVSDAERTGGDKPQDRRVRADDVATIIYTSGTAGQAKGVLLTQRNLALNAEIARRSVAAGPNDVLLSILPLSHSLERICGYYSALAGGTAVAFAEDLTTVADNIKEIRPTLMIVVPRFLEGLRDKLSQQRRTSPPLRRGLLGLAHRLGTRSVLHRRGVLTAPFGIRLAALALDAVVGRQVRRKLGGRLRNFICGGAPLARNVLVDLEALGCRVRQGYGLTETSGPICVDDLTSPPGTVGHLYPGMEIDLAAGGELLVRGFSVMPGYWNRPDDTPAVLDEDGWLHTGDLARTDPMGRLIITGRAKDLIVLTTGKKVAPLALEQELRRQAEIQEAMVVGHGRAHLAAIVIPDPQLLATGARDAAECREVVTDPETLDRLAGIVREINAGRPRHQRIRRLAALSRPFTLERGELTPSLKLRRHVVERKWADLIDQIFAKTVPPTVRVVDGEPWAMAAEA